MTDPVIRLPTSLQLQAFEMVAELGSVAEAACRLGVGASALAKRLTALEQLVGESLLVRDASALTLTKAGQHYLDQIRPVMDMLRAAPHPACGRHASPHSPCRGGDAKNGDVFPSMHEPRGNRLSALDSDWRSTSR